MERLQLSINKIQSELSQAFERLRVEDLQKELSSLQTDMAQPDFWQDNKKAQEVSQRESKLRTQITPWLDLQNDLNDLKELAESDDSSLQSELEHQAENIRLRFEAHKKDLQFSGKYDDHDAILRLHAGVGGTDAQDWAEMLMRMYLRWAERANMKTELLEESRGEEAGIKSVMIDISGPYAFGKLKSEHGVHRLVRLSPFNADHLRQTSFALVEVLPKIEAPGEVEIDDSDLKIDVFRAGGHGGQSVNTTDSAVRVTHLPTGITVSIQNERSQLQNKETALKVLKSKLAQLAVEQHQETVANLKGPTRSAEWGNQIRSYVLHPYTLVKDNRTKHEERDAQAVLDGKLDGFIDAFLETSRPDI